MTEKYDNELCEAWKEEVDKLLIFVSNTASVLVYSIVELTTTNGRLVSSRRQ
jgi:hypothetical protein